jgi:hypothetical protein
MSLLKIRATSSGLSLRRVVMGGWPMLKFARKPFGWPILAGFARVGLLVFFLVTVLSAYDGEAPWPTESKCARPC